MSLDIRPKSECKYDLISLGEIMLRLDPGEGRIRTSRQFNAWEGGGEYNVARGLRRCFGLTTGVATAFADNEIGRLIEDFILQGGVDTSLIKWLPYDGLGRKLETVSILPKGALYKRSGLSTDRGLTASSQLQPGDFDWDEIFGNQGVRWFHTGGIFAALSESTANVTTEAVQAAQKYGTVVSYDLNYRPSLWKSIGGIKKAQEVNRAIARNVDVMIGNEEDFTACLGFEVEGVDENISNIEVDQFKNMIHKVVAEFSNFKATATTLRSVKTATINDWGAICWENGEFYEAIHRPELEIFDRVGGGDSFASGLIYGFLQGYDGDKAVNYGAAHGALAMTTPGDTSMATLEDVEKVVRGGGARVVR